MNKVSETFHTLEEARINMGEQVYQQTLQLLLKEKVVEPEARAQAGSARSNFMKQFEKCQCTDGMQAMFCMYGHLTECHYPQTCDEAECSHYKAEMESE